MAIESNLKAALIRREWWEGCMRILPPAEQLCLYNAICEYSFTGSVSSDLPQVVAALWTLIRPVLDEDKAKYSARCERNASNAKRGGVSQSLPVAPSRSQSLPVATNTNNNTNNNNNNNNTSISFTELGERERFLVLGIFFSRGCSDVLGEYSRFNNYYSALGWKNNKGAAITNPAAAARQWRADSADPELASMRERYYLAFRDCTYYIDAIWSDYRGAESRDNVLTLKYQCGQDVISQIDENCMPQMRKLAQSYSCSSLQYAYIAPPR